jgi:hypothetical protein
MKKAIVFFLLGFIFKLNYAQENFSLALNEISSINAPAIHSGAFAIYNGKWIMLGGRQNGLHGFQPPFAFPTSGANTNVYVVDPATGQSYSSSLSVLPTRLYEALTSSNMQFYLHDSTLYMVGGYGWVDSLQNFITFPTLTAINVAGLTNAVVNGSPIGSYFRLIEDSTMAICGAHLQMIDSTYYLVFGHKFDGYYNRTDTTGFHVQKYSHEIRKFKIADDGTNLSIYDYEAVQDTNNFRRRDYNLIPQLYPGNVKGLTAFSGVFKKGVNLPHLDVVTIIGNTYAVSTTFNQNLSQYHSAFAAIYDSSVQIQHNIFFGGMSMYYIDSAGNTVLDSMVPFVNTISDVVRDFDYNYQEFNMNIRMPALLGSNAYFFLDNNVPVLQHEFVNLNALPQSSRIGYIIGGIESPEANINETDPTLSFASSRVFEVILNKGTGISKPTAISNDVVNFICYPNPVNDLMNVEFTLNTPGNVTLAVYDMQGKLLNEVVNKRMETGAYRLNVNTRLYGAGAYNCVVTFNGVRKATRFVKE